MLNEADTRAKLIDPRLHQDGWLEEIVAGLLEKQVQITAILEELRQMLNEPSV